MIRITTQNAQIGINTTNAQLSIQQPKAYHELNIVDPSLDIHTEHVKVQIDQTQCFNESGLKNMEALTRDFAAQGKQAALEGISRRSQEGDRLAAISNGGNAIAEIALSNRFTTHVFDIDTMPKSRPTIDFIGGTVDIVVHDGYVDVQSQKNKPVIDVQLGDVEVSMLQYQDIKFEYVEDKKGIDVKL
jgi:hypothetical protein